MQLQNSISFRTVGDREDRSAVSSALGVSQRQSAHVVLLAPSKQHGRRGLAPCNLLRALLLECLVALSQFTLPQLVRSLLFAAVAAVSALAPGRSEVARGSRRHIATSGVRSSVVAEQRVIGPCIRRHTLVTSIAVRSRRQRHHRILVRRCSVRVPLVRLHSRHIRNTKLTVRRVPLQGILLRQRGRS